MRQNYSLDDIMKMDRMYRRDFINTISGFKSCQLIGTIGYNNVPNVAIFNSLVHISATPPHLGFMIRPLTVARQTYHNIKARKHFTVNAVTKDMMEKAHQTSAKYDDRTSEFTATGLNPFFSDTIVAPYVEESPIQLGLEWVEEHEIKANGCILIVGKIIEIRIDDHLLSESGHVLLESAEILSVAGLDRYYLPEFIDQRTYARP
jgi:flavin reductase (DIM6/NTAB) family NADH-FMN oxidoreductase RutF